MKNSLKSTKTTIICWIIIGFLLIGLSVYAVFDVNGGRQPVQNGVSTATKMPTPTEVLLPTAGDTTAEVLVTTVEPEFQRIQAYVPETDCHIVFTYTGVTDIRGRFDEVVAATQIEEGAIARVSYDTADNKLYALKLVDADWYYPEQSRVEIRLDKNMLTVAGNHYRLGNNVIVVENGEEISPLSLASVDVLTLKGMGDRVFQIERVKGHGTLHLKSAEAFVGGTFYIDGKAAEEVIAQMQMTMREGEYRLALENGTLYAESNVTIEQDKVCEWDVQEFLPPEPVFGRVEFLIEPQGAQLYIDEKLCDNIAFANLEYGEHTVRVYKDGYIDWNGKITVNSEELLFTVALVPVEKLVPEEILTPTPEAEPTPEVTPSPAPDPRQENEAPAPTQGAQEDESQEEIEVRIVWHPKSVVSVDSVYIGTTDETGILTAKLKYGIHQFEFTQILLDGATRPQSFTAEVDAQTVVLNFFISN